MDVEEVSEVDQYVNLIEQQKKVLQAAQKRKGERPRDVKPRSKIISDHMMQVMTRQMMALSPLNHMIQSSILAISRSVQGS
jgi:hypothetical protein